MMALGGTGRVDPAQIGLGDRGGALLHPLIIATALGLAAAPPGLRLPAAIDALLAYAGRAAAPAALFAFGVGLAAGPSAVPLETPVLIAVKLVVHPAIVYLLLSWVGGFDRVWVHAAVLMAALPPAGTS